VSVATAAAQPTLLSQITGDISSALGLSTLLPAAQTALAVVQTVMPITAVLTGGSSAFISLSGALGAAQTAVGAAQGLAATQIGAVASAATIGRDRVRRRGRSGGGIGGPGRLGRRDVGCAGFVGRAVRNLAG
jgi:hypothetical protein